jgi:chemotaxis protein methyltransferase CheR
MDGAGSRRRIRRFLSAGAWRRGSTLPWVQRTVPARLSAQESNLAAPSLRYPAGQVAEFELSAGEFRDIAARIKQSTGIVLGESKRELVHGRLARRLRTLGCASFTDYLRRLDEPDGAEENILLVNALTTNLTGFYREKHHFETLARDALPGIVTSSRQRRLRIWSAGCSSGQEPYTISMVLRDTIADLKRWDALILATDIDSNMIARAREGIYDADSAATIARAARARYVHDLPDGQVVMSDALKALIRFKRLNLIGPWPMAGPFDIIFCRNVVIYFDKDTQRALFDRYADMLRPDGWLFIGHSESLYRVSDRFRHLGQTMYRKIQ